MARVSFSGLDLSFMEPLTKRPANDNPPMQAHPARSDFPCPHFPRGILSRPVQSMADGKTYTNLHDYERSLKAQGFKIKESGER